jgi:rare lipoprotein A
MALPSSQQSQKHRRRVVLWATLAGLAIGSFGCARVAPPPIVATPVPKIGFLEDGVASWYGVPFHGRATASGEIYDMEASTAAHRTLPFGTVLQVDNLDNAYTTTVRVNDRGPFVKGRNLDLSRRAARELEMIGPGTARVRLTIVSAPSPENCWMVQVGAFSDGENADLLRRSLEREGHAVQITTSPNGLYRVRTGPFQSRIEGERIMGETEGMLLGCGVSDS